MVALPAAQAAMDTHRGVVAVAEHGLAFLRNLFVAEAHQVIRLDLLVLLFACMLCTGVVDGGRVACNPCAVSASSLSRLWSCAVFTTAFGSLSL